MSSSSSTPAGRLRALAGSPHLLPLCLLTLAVLALIAPTLRLYMWTGHERFHAVGRVRDLCRLWAVQGPFHAPWFPEVCFGQGWPFFTFYAPLSYDAAAIFHFLFGLDYGAATRLSFYVSLWLSGALMYALALKKDCGLRSRRPTGPSHLDGGLKDEVTGSADALVRASSENPQSAIRNSPWWALAAALVYVFTPYHLTDIFTRGSLAESWIWAVLPLLFLTLEASRERGFAPRTILTVGLATAALMLTHNIFALYGVLVVGAWTLATARDWRWPLAVAAGGVLGAVLSAYFWLPMMLLKQWVPAGLLEVMEATPEHLRLHALGWQQYFIEQLGMGESIAGWHDGFGINLGVCVGLGLLAGVAALAGPGLGRFERRRLGVLLALAALALFMTTSLMPWAWAPPLLRYVQFPWRLLLLTSFLGSLALGWGGPALGRWLHPRWPALLAAALGLSGAWCTLFWEVPPMSDKGMDEFIATEERALVFSGCQKIDYLPRWCPRYLINYRYHQDFPIQPSRIQRASGPLAVRDYLHRGTAYFYTYTAPAEVRAVIQVFFFPGWTLRIDGEDAPGRIACDSSESGPQTGYVTLRLPPGEHVAELKYELSPPGRVGRGITIAGWLGVLGLSAVAARRKKSKVTPMN